MFFVFSFIFAVTFDSPMNISSPDLYNSKSNKDFVDIDLIEDMNCGVIGEYAHSIFDYLREAEVRWAFIMLPHKFSTISL